MNSLTKKFIGLAVGGTGALAYLGLKKPWKKVAAPESRTRVNQESEKASKFGNAQGFSLTQAKFVRESLVAYKDFPKPGITFQDVFSGIFLKPDALKTLMQLMREKAVSLEGEVDCVVGLDSRGFLMGPTMAEAIGVPFVPIRKKGKLPGDCCGTSYELEYGSAEIEIQTIGFKENGLRKALIVDDLLATGGTMEAAVKLIRDCGATPVECFVIIELTGLEGRSRIESNETRVSAIVEI